MLVVLALLYGCSSLRPPQKTLPSVKDTMRIAGTFEFEGLKGRVVIFLKEPDLVRIELYGAMNSLVLVLAGNSESCRYYIDGMVKRCRWTESLFIAPDEFVALLSGRYSRLSGWQSRKDGTGRVVELIRYYSRNQRVRITIDAYRELAGNPVPSALTIESRGKRLRLELPVALMEEVEQGIFMLGLKRAVPPRSIQTLACLTRRALSC